jgi:glycosyltransferase involved in cell wall biosynthesis
MRKVAIITDPAHANWILGGLAREISSSLPSFFDTPVSVSKIRSKFVLKSLLEVIKLLIKGKPLLFSSLTPMENFFKYSMVKRNPLFLVFTHQNGLFSKRQEKLLQRVDIIFVHSPKDIEIFKNLGLNCRIVPFIGAIKSENFSRSVTAGEVIVYIGTPVERKNPKLFLQFARANPHIQFRILGKDWRKSRYWEELMSLGNLEYREINSPICTEDLDGCSHYLMISSLEGGPIPLLETMAAGLIPIATKTGIAIDFLSEIGLTDQLIDSPFNFNEITQKILNQYSESKINNAIQIAKRYNIERFSNILKFEIDFYLQTLKDYK